ncbi:MAG: hypothetical protein DHS20C05_10790 [Hyphococcus sp.]|nr:MAG: hypothetical protein DHS20C05_10790 [Marinicaulis sp.]
MPWFRCVVLGENFTLIVDGEARDFGFYTTRWVEAGNADSAEMKALAILKSDELLAELPKEHRSPEAKVYFQEIEELSEKPQQAPGAGFTWFEMEEVRESGQHDEARSIELGAND